MVGSRRAARTANGEATARAGGRLGRFLFAGGGLALLAACSAAPTPSSSPLAAAPGPARAAPVAIRIPAPRSLTGLSAAQVVALLGKPDFRRAEPPAELWQYRGADCVLDLFFYEGAGGARVLHSETRDRSLLGAGGGDCAGGGDALTRRLQQTRL
jgi:hypothetical protein